MTLAAPLWRLVRFFPGTPALKAKANSSKWRAVYPVIKLGRLHQGDPPLNVNKCKFSSCVLFMIRSGDSPCPTD